MNLLALECSAVAASCALLRDGELIAQSLLNVRSTHSQTLLPMTVSLLERVGLSVRDVDGFAVANGPGSFTGVRIGVSAVKGMALPGDKPCVGVSTLLAAALSHPYGDGYLCAAMDARCAQVYTALFSLQNGQATRLTPDRALSAETLCAELEALHADVTLVGDGAAVVAAQEACPPHARLAPAPFRLQNAVGVARAAYTAFCAGETVSAEELMPVYLRLPQAERELKQRKGESV